MSLKTKLTSLITTFVLLCSLLTVGVFAVKNTTFNVGGDIVFNVKGIEATITRGATAGFTADKTIGDAAGNILSNIELNNNMSAQDVADEFAPWSGLNLAFSENVATIKLTITNTAKAGADNYLDISAIASATTKNNARVSVANDAGGVTALLQPQQSASFTITFSVIDDEYSANLEGFNVDFNMKKLTISEIPSYDADSRLLINCNTTAKTASVTGNNITQANTKLEIPSYVKSGDVVCAVISIGESVFQSCSNLTNITLPNTVKDIGVYAFKFCEGMTSITIPDSVTTIGDYAFQDCSNLTSVILSSNLESIGRDTFAFCSSLESVIIPDSVIGIGRYAFKNCSNLVEITLSKNLLETGGAIFSGCTNLKYNEFNNCKYLGTKNNPYFYADGVIDGNQTSYILNQNCKILGANTFYQNSKVEEVILPDKMVSISEFSFDQCTSLTTINMPSKLQYIGMAAFQVCTSLTTINMPSKLQYIGAHAFYSCTAITNINLPEGLEFIGDCAFEHCSSAQNTKITIPSTIKQIGGTSYDPNNPDLNVIGSDVFYNVATNSLQSFEMVENDHFKVVDGVLYRKDSEGNPSVMIAYPSAKQDQKFIMPNTVVDAFGFSLSRAFNLREIVLSDNFVIRQSQEEAPENSGWGNNLSIMNYIYSGVTTITCNDTNENYMSYNGAVYSKDGKTLYYAPMLSGLLKTDETEATLTIKEGTTSIYFGAIGREADYSGNYVDNNLNSQNQLKRFDKIYIPSTLESIDDDTLTRINNLSWTIEIGEGNSHFKVNSSGKLEKIV